MSLKRVMPWLVAALLSNVAGMTIAAAFGRSQLTGVLAAVFAGMMMVVSLLANWPYWHLRPADPEAQRFAAARRNARLTAITCAWAALAMQLMYTPRLTRLWWQHGWEYALAFALLAAGAFLYAHLTRADSATARRLDSYAGLLAGGQAVAAACGLTFLVASGKLASSRVDWAANWVFLSAALALTGLGAIALRTHARLTRS